MPTVPAAPASAAPAAAPATALRDTRKCHHGKAWVSDNTSPLRAAA